MVALSGLCIVGALAPRGLSLGHRYGWCQVRSSLCRRLRRRLLTRVALDGRLGGRFSRSPELPIAARQHTAPDQQGPDGVGRLGAVIEPVLGPLGVDPQRIGIGFRVVDPDLLDKAAIARPTNVGGNDPIAWLSLSSHTPQSQLNHAGWLPFLIICTSEL